MNNLFNSYFLKNVQHTKIQIYFNNFYFNNYMIY